MWSFLFFGVTFVLFGVVRSTGAVWPPLVILLITLWFIRPPFALALQDRFGADAIWWSFPLGSLISMLLAMAYYRFGGWRRARMLSPAHYGAGADHRTGRAGRGDRRGRGLTVPQPAAVCVPAP